MGPGSGTTGASSRTCYAKSVHTQQYLSLAGWGATEVPFSNVPVGPTGISAMPRRPVRRAAELPCSAHPRHVCALQTGCGLLFPGFYPCGTHEHGLFLSPVRVTGASEMACTGLDKRR